MSEFRIAYNYTMKKERGVTTDTGGYTVDGISSKAHPDLDLDTLEEQQKYEFYQREYWEKYNCNLIVNQRIANELYDTAVNCGGITSSIILQRSFNELNDMMEKSGRKKICKNLRIDGRIGPITAKAINHKRTHEYYNILYILQTIKQYNYYVKLGNNEKYQKYLLGWMNKRVADFEELK